MQNELLLWIAVFFAIVGTVTAFFWVRRVRERAKWRSKRPIHVPIRRDGA